MSYAGDEFYFLHVVSEIQDSSALLAGMIGVNSALMIGHNDEEQVQQKVKIRSQKITLSLQIDGKMWDCIFRKRLMS